MNESEVIEEHVTAPCVAEPCLQSIELKNFRCFDKVYFDFDGPLILIQGLNGSGKTSLLEALHYLCYVRSFRTHLPRELVQFGKDGFFLKAVFNNQEISIGFAHGKRHIKVNQKIISSYEELRQAYRIITVTEDDLGIVKAGPEKRRNFLDHALLLHHPELLVPFKAYKNILDNRNALLQRHDCDPEELEIWTQKLWEQTNSMQQYRYEFLEHLKAAIQEELTTTWKGEYKLVIRYEPKKIEKTQSWQEFHAYWVHSLKQNELRYRRSLFGAHLDDFSITFQNKPARLYSSRGQQKLIVLLIKIAQVRQLIKEQGATTFLLDDFMADFDETVMVKLICACINLKTQLIFTSPLEGGAEINLLKDLGCDTIKLKS